MLGLAASYFNSTPIDGWDPTAGGTWVVDVSRGTLQIYDRFVSDRTFGAKKRILAIGEHSQDLPPQYAVVRPQGSRPYMVEAKNFDVAGGAAYQCVYVLHEATVRVRIHEMVQGTLPSGMPGPAVRTLREEVWGDLDRFGSTNGEFDQVRRELDSLWLERGTIVLPSFQVEVNGLFYLVREMGLHGDLTFCRLERITS